MESRAFLMLPLVNCCLLTFVDVVESIVKCFNNNQPSHIPAIQRFTLIHIHMISVRNTVERNLTQSWCRRGLIAVFPRLCIWFENIENTLQQKPRRPYSCNTTLRPYLYMYDNCLERCSSGISSILDVAIGWLLVTHVCGSDWKDREKAATTIN